jgi:hypothetical protein
MDTKTRLTASAIGALTLVLFACQSGSQPTPEAGTSGNPGTTQQSAARPVAEPRVQNLTVPSGTSLTIRLTSAIDSGTTPAGASFEGSLANPLTVGGVEVASAGSMVTGKVTNVVSAGRLSKPAELSLALTSLTPQGGRTTAISTEAWSEKGTSHKTRNVEMIGGGGGVGALIGALTGGKKGAAIGAAVGAGAGTGVAAATGKKEIALPAETSITFRLTAPVSLPATRMP